jgi:hypothetical protein
MPGCDCASHTGARTIQAPFSEVQLLDASLSQRGSSLFQNKVFHKPII